jgi:hypothetical protein
MKRNKTILATFGILFMVYLFLYANEFQIRTRTEFRVILAELVIGLAMIVLLLLVKTKWWIKLISTICLIAILMFGLPITGLWQHSLKKYVAEEKSEYINLAKQIDVFDNENLTYVSCFNNQINSQPKLNSIEIESNKKPFCELINNLDCVEVSLDKSNNKYLFVMSRFIDNGYGLLYCKSNLEIEQIFSKRINGLEITSVVKVEKGWYYVSFT